MKVPEDKKLYLNIGCGYHFHNDWVNLDFKKTGKDVIAHNLLKGIPFSDNTFEVVYHSHLLEHFKPQDGAYLISECFRVLKPSGIIRIAVPDLEVIARNYITFLDKALEGDKEAEDNYDWTVLELFDQITRQVSGGNMAIYLKGELPNKEFIISRLGHEAEEVILSKDNFGNKANINSKRGIKRAIINMIRKLLPTAMLNAYQIGVFRESGENHQWMYDRFSLCRLLRHNGFDSTECVSAQKSNITNWSTCNLDVINGLIRKPDSLFVEAFKP